MNFENMKRIRDALVSPATAILVTQLQHLGFPPDLAVIFAPLLVDTGSILYIWAIERREELNQYGSREKYAVERTDRMLQYLGKLLSKEHLQPHDIEDLVTKYPNVRDLVERIIRHVEEDTESGKAQYYASLLKNVICKPTGRTITLLEEQAMADALRNISDTDIQLLRVWLDLPQEGFTDESGNEVKIPTELELSHTQVMGNLGRDFSDLSSVATFHTWGYLDGRLNNLVRLGLVSVEYRTVAAEENWDRDNPTEGHYRLTDFGWAFTGFVERNADWPR